MSDKLVLKQDVYNKLMINAITVQCWSISQLMIMMRWKMVFLNKYFRTYNKTINERNKPLSQCSTQFGKEEKYKNRDIPNEKNTL